MPLLILCTCMQNCMLEAITRSNYWYIVGGVLRLELIAPIELLSELEIMVRWGYFPIRIVFRSGTSLEKENQCRVWHLQRETYSINRVTFIMTIQQ